MTAYSRSARNGKMTFISMTWPYLSLVMTDNMQRNWRITWLWKGLRSFMTDLSKQVH